MRLKFLVQIKSSIPPKHYLALLIFLTIALASTATSILYIGSNSNQQVLSYEDRLALSSSQASQAIKKYRALQAKLPEYEQKGVDTALAKETLTQIRTLIYHKHDYPLALAKLSGLEAGLQELLAQKIAEEKQYGAVTGKVTKTDNTPLSQATVALYQNNNKTTETKTAADGAYSITHILQGDYTIKASLSGYNTQSKAVKIEGEKTAAIDFSLTVYVAKPKATSAPSTSSSSDGYGSYSRQTVSTSRGAFTVDIITTDLNNSAVKIVTDTAASSECANNCPTKSLSSYYSSNNGFAAINGTYFCPTDYASCAGQTGSYFWRIFNSNLHYFINANNSYTDNDPILVFTTGNTAHFYRQASSFSAGSSTQAAIAGAEIVYGNQVSYNYDRLDDKQKYTKSNRGALGIKGSTVYGVVGRSATVIDMAYVMQALGVDAALNLDGGGSSALMYNGSYKVGPGRSLPNAIIFSRR